MSSPNRFDYVAYDDVAQRQQSDAKCRVQSVESLIENLGKGRYQSLALTALEEAYAWIGKAIRDAQIARNGDAPLEERRNNG